MKTSLRLRICLAALVLAGCSTAVRHDPVPPRIVSGAEIMPHRVVVWALGHEPGQLTLTLDTRPAKAFRYRFDSAGTLHWPVDNLGPRDAYTLKWEFVPDSGAVTAAGFRRFRLPPASDERAAVRFAFGADLGGQNVCRDRELGFPVFDTIGRYKPDFFVALGDMVYADDICEATGLYGNAQVPGNFPAARRDVEFLAHWLYHYADPALAQFRAAVPWYTTWDDHEVLNDFSPARDFRADEPGRRLLASGRHALLDFHPVSGDVLYRRIGWGRHLDLFVLDTRSYRDANEALDTDAKPKTLLGETQRRWLIDGLQSSRATWKIVASSVPLAIPTGTAAPGARDGWANGDSDTGFERELLAILAASARGGVENLLFVSADVHFATVLRHAPFEEPFAFDEIVVGPLNAGIYPTHLLDETLAPKRLFFFGPDPATPAMSFEQALYWFNFGVIDIDSDGALRVRIVNALGDEVYELRRRPSSGVVGQDE